MPMLRQCSHAACATLTLGAFCVEHDAPVTRTFVRGRPHPPLPAGYFTVGHVEPIAQTPVEPPRPAVAA